MNAREKTELIDMQQPPRDNRDAALARFVEEFVAPCLSAGYRDSLNGMIREYGKACYGRGYQEGAQWR